ncbi:unknown protein [Seminavis robusta]|uniref:SnoaL-like domain-containing protein n=1 Tax=Seminavis robusta TaxID=568900 RepID=A0A9N8EQW9_9STRA|nr:unknown protein [Seminavis robusta]|eukprot:Sro1704_g292380.1 n/a (149) ;mRNA; r:14422-15002
MENAKLTREFMRRYNNHDLPGARAMLTDDYFTVFRDHEMTWDDLKSETQKISDAFPDYKFLFERLEARSDGVVILHNFVPSGTHTGTPYGFGPCPEIPPTGVHVQNDPEEVIHFYFRNGKICQNAVYTDGEFVGPVGIYTQIGGFPFA